MIGFVNWLLRTEIEDRAKNFSSAPRISESQEHLGRDM